MGVLGGHWGFLTGDLENRVILDVMDDPVWPKGRYPESFVSISSLKVCQEGGFLYGGTWRVLRVPDRRLKGQGHPWCHGWPCLTPMKIPWKFRVDIFIRSVSRMGGPSWEYLEDVEGSWQETWRTGSSLTSWMYLVDPKNHILNVLCHYLYFWPRYRVCYARNKNVTRKQTDTAQIYIRYIISLKIFKQISYLGYVNDFDNVLASELKYME